MKETAVAFSDWEAIKLSYRLRKKNKEDQQAAVAKGFAKPWPEHGIEFDKKALKSMGYVSSEQTVLSGVKGYTFYKEDGSGRFLRSEMLVVQKMARKV